jgi:hypothetical protein
MIKKWHEVIKSRDPSLLEKLLADDVVLHSPVVHSLIEGKKLVSLYLNAALHTFLNETFDYIRQLDCHPEHVLEFQLELEGIYINGVDMIRFNEKGQIVDFKVMLRPLQGLNLIHQKMGQMLEKLG